MSFAFNFLESTATAATTPETGDDHCCTDQSPPFRWLPIEDDDLKKACHDSSSFQRLKLLERNSEDDDEDEVVWFLSSKTGGINDDTNSDLIPGVYEGGSKVWECSIDLCRYLARNWVTPSSSSSTQLSVLELGCGHGLPGCWMLRQKIASHVIFSDFNDYVLRDITLPNIIKNVAIDDDDDQPTLDSIRQRVSLAAGDWNVLSNDHLQDRYFDVILAAETTYSPKAAADTARIVKRHLRGVAYIATKRYYFGVGGGSDAFRAAIEGDEFHVETVQVYDDGSSNIRELIKVTSK